MKKIISLVTILFLTILAGCQSPLKNAKNYIREQIPEYVISDFSLPSKSNGYSIEYNCSDNLIVTVLSNESTYFNVTRGATDENATITASFSKLNATSKETYNTCIIGITNNVNIDNFTLLKKTRENTAFSVSKFVVDANNSDYYYTNTKFEDNLVAISYERGLKSYLDNDGNVEHDLSKEYFTYDETTDFVNAFNTGERDKLFKIFSGKLSRSGYEFGIDMTDYYSAFTQFDKTAYEYLMARINKLLGIDIELLLDHLSEFEDNDTTYDMLFNELFEYVPKSVFYIMNYDTISDLLLDLFVIFDPSLARDDIKNASGGFLIDNFLRLSGDKLTYDAYSGSLITGMKNFLNSQSATDYAGKNQYDMFEYFDKYKNSEFQTAYVKIEYDISGNMKLFDLSYSRIKITPDSKTGNIGDFVNINYSHNYNYVVSNIGNTTCKEIVIPSDNLVINEAISQFNSYVGAAPIRLSSNLALPETLVSGDVGLSYKSSDTSALEIQKISGDLFAVIYRKSTDTNVLLTVEFTDGSEIESRTYNVIVIKESIVNDAYIVNPDHSTNKLYNDMLKADLRFGGLPTVSANDSSQVINQNLLVVPIEFNDYAFETGAKTRIEKAFFGTNEDTGWESLKTYYYKSSYGKIVFGGTVLPIYKPTNDSTYYANLKTDGNFSGDYALLKEILINYDSTVDFSKYDTDSDGCIDSIVLVYSVPYNHDSDWWAWVYQYYTDYTEAYDGVEAGYYMWVSYDFFNDGFSGLPGIKINCETIIHETGHLFGLDDYYDYNDTIGPNGGLGGFDMMDYNSGDHNSFSKIMLGWTVPMIITGTTTISLNPFESSGEVLLIPAAWNGSNSMSYYSEYLLVEFYTPTGLNAARADGYWLFENNGVKIFHVNAEFGGNLGGGSYWSMHKYNNSDTANMLIRYIEADGNSSIPTTGDARDSDLFHQGSSLNNYNWYKTYGGTTKIPFTIEILELVSSEVTIKITF